MAGTDPLPGIAVREDPAVPGGEIFVVQSQRCARHGRLFWCFECQEPAVRITNIADPEGDTMPISPSPDAPVHAARNRLVCAVLAVKLSEYAPQRAGPFSAAQTAAWQEVDEAAGALAAAALSAAPEDAFQRMLRAQAQRTDAKANPDPGSLRLLLRASGTVDSFQSAYRAGDTFSASASWHIAVTPGAELVLAWTEHGGAYEATLARWRQGPDGSEGRDVTSLLAGLPGAIGAGE
jgi:hypothetical protein